MELYNQKWVTVFGKSRTAVTIGGAIFYVGSVGNVPAALRRHEGAHRDQWRRGYYIGFLITYLYFHFKFGYWNNPYEVEARISEIK